MAVPFIYLVMALGCLLLLLSVLGMACHLVPKPLIYLGKISYGLYVFHLFFYWLFTGKVIPRFLGHEPELVRVLAIYGFTLSSTVGTAALSYHFYEKPFLRLKERHAFVKSRSTHE